MTERRDGHIVMLIECFYPHLGGGSLSQWKFAQQAVKRGYDVTVFTPQFEDYSRRETVNGVEIRRPFPGPPDQDNLNTLYAFLRRILFNVLLLPYLLLYLPRLKPTALYSPSHLLHPVGKLLSICYGIQYLQFIGFSPSVRSTDQRDLQLYLEQLNFRFFMGDIVFARNQVIVEQVKKHNLGSHVERIDGVVDADKIHQAYHEIDSSTVRSELGIPNDATLLCWVGRMVEIKNPIAAIETLQQLPEEYHLVMVGDGPRKEQISAEVQSSDVSDRTHFTGRVDHQRALEIIKSADGTLLTSETESYPTVVFESLALDTPVFATPVGILPHLSECSLYLGEIDSIHEIILQNIGRNNETDGISREDLEKYSITNFTETVLSTLQDH